MSAARLGWLAALVLAWPAGVRAASAEAPAATSAYDAEGRRDPFVPLVRNGRIIGIPKPGAQLGALPTLFGILWDPQGQSIALLDDGEAKVGDTVSGYKVIEITRDTVVLGNGAEPVVLQITFEEEPAPNSATANGR